MKRALWITAIAIALLLLAAVGWIIGLVRRPASTFEPTARTRRHVSAHEFDEERRHLTRLAAAASSAAAV